MRQEELPIASTLTLQEVAEELLKFLEEDYLWATNDKVEYERNKLQTRLAILKACLKSGTTRKYGV